MPVVLARMQAHPATHTLTLTLTAMHTAMQAHPGTRRTYHTWR